MNYPIQLYDDSPKHTDPPSSDRWIEDSVFFEKKIGKQVVLPQSEQFIGSGFSLKKSLSLFVFFVLVVGALFVRLLHIQVVKGETYLQLAKGNRERIIPVPSERGLLFDRNERQLTTNIPNFSLAIVPQDLPHDLLERNLLIQRLSQITKKTPEQIDGFLAEYGSYSYESIVIQENLDYQTALLVEIESTRLPGIHMYVGSKRLYLHPQSLDDSPSSSSRFTTLSHVLGYLGKLDRAELDALYTHGYLPSDTIGKIGIEKAYEDVLRGMYGKRVTEVDALGREQTILSEEAPSPGKHLILSIDSEMQAALERIMKKHLDLLGKTRGTAVIMDPRNGEILSLLSLPAFDNNDFSGGITQEKYTQYISDTNKPLFHRAIAGVYPSGSTIKPAIAAAALQEGIIQPTTAFVSTGGIRIGQWFFPDWLSGGHGSTDVRKSLAQSVNTFYYYIGGGFGSFVGLGVDVLTNYLKEFGFSQPLGIDLPGEAAGFLPTRDWKEQTKGERWYIGDTYNLSIGQGDLSVTPLQIASLTATIANGGTLYQPHVVTAVVDPLTRERQPINPVVIRESFISRSHIETTRLGMRDCVVYGSCRRLSALPFAAAGKTGTAQWSSEKETHAWFTSFAPFDKPEIAITVLVEEGGEGSSAAVPIVHEFYQWWDDYQNLDGA